MTKLYVGNLPWSASEDDLRELFSPIAEVNSVTVITDRETGRSRGFAFVELDKADADKAISQLNGQELGGRQLRINEAQDRPKRSSGGGRW